MFVKKTYREGRKAGTHTDKNRTGMDTGSIGVRQRKVSRQTQHIVTAEGHPSCVKPPVLYFLFYSQGNKERVCVFLKGTPQVFCDTAHVAHCISFQEQPLTES